MKWPWFSSSLGSSFYVPAYIVNSPFHPEIVIRHGWGLPCNGIWHTIGVPGYNYTSLLFPTPVLTLISVFLPWFERIDLVTLEIRLIYTRARTSLSLMNESEIFFECPIFAFSAIYSIFSIVLCSSPSRVLAWIVKRDILLPNSICCLETASTLITDALVVWGITDFDFLWSTSFFLYELITSVIESSLSDSF